MRTVGHGYLLAVTAEQLDSEQFATLTTAGQDALEAADPARARDLLSEAIGLWRGPPLSEVGFDDFAQAEIRRLEELRLLAIEARVEADLMLGGHAELVGDLSGMLVEHLGRERLAGQLMLALYRCGRQNEALGGLPPSSRASARRRRPCARARAAGAPNPGAGTGPIARNSYENDDAHVRAHAI